LHLAITQNITLDGVIEATGGWFSPAGQDAPDVSDIEEELRDQMGREDGLLLGRSTFEEFRGYWPKQTDDATGITDHLNNVQKYVATTTLESPEWDRTTLLRGPLLEEVEALREMPGNDLGVTGSISVVHQLIEARLVDEYRLFVYPVVLGRGKRLFVEGADVPKLRLVEAKPFRSGIVLLKYRPVIASAG
jgi:dihydrofolate reductase